jgi:hypothetical protein
MSERGLREIEQKLIIAGRRILGCAREGLVPAAVRDFPAHSALRSV